VARVSWTLQDEWRSLSLFDELATEIKKRRDPCESRRTKGFAGMKTIRSEMRTAHCELHLSANFYCGIDCWISNFDAA